MKTGRMGDWAAMFAACCVFSVSAFAQAQVPDYDFDWATIGDVNNPAYEGGPGGGLAGRGSVSYEYRMSKLEVTSAQWLEFINIFAPQAPNPGSFLRPSFSGITDKPGGGAGSYILKPDVPNAGMIGVYGISWREAAMYCNWLHNGKSKEWSAIQNGAYDASTFGTNPNNSFTDQVTHFSDAKFWIPTLDEWMKAAYYDPSKYGQGSPGWWTYPYGSDSPPTPGLPGFGQTTAGVTDPGAFVNILNVPLGAYPNASSPWGLLDVSGGAREWTEETEPGLWHWSRGVKGAYPGATGFSLDWDQIYTVDYNGPDFGYLAGLRLASAVPNPGGLALLFVSLVHNQRCRRD